MLANPRLVKAKTVEQNNQIEVAFQRKGGILTRPVEGRQKQPKAQRIRHWSQDICRARP